MKVSDMISFGVAILAAGLFLSCDTEPSASPVHDNHDVENVTVKFEPEMKSLIRNPMMGWVLYDDACGEVSNAEKYWQDQGTVADMFGSVFYWRSRWSELEPEEGVYAWEHNENFKALIQGALDHGLKLAFRVYVDSQDNAHQATPDFVRQAGAQGYQNTYWTPYVDDPVFQEKFANFIRAFAAEFDDPARVDFIDAYNLGWWGEGHHVQYLNPANKAKVYKWITETYGNAFSKVILVTNFGTEMGFDIEKKLAIQDQGYIIRRDSMGSQWFQYSDIQTVLSVFPDVAFIAECCYWGGYSDTYQPWKDDIKYGSRFSGWLDFYKQAYTDAVNARANMLDLRQAAESRGWTRKARELVDAFIVNGGYRFTPVEISCPQQTDGNFKISHTWKNSGVGVCPNNNRRWNYKYKVAFALLDSSDKPAAYYIVPDAEPSSWLKEKDTSYESTVHLTAPSGEYTLAVAVVDTADGDKPGINLAVQKWECAGGWLKITKLKINNPRFK